MGGAASNNRYEKWARNRFEAALAEVENRLDDKARLWADLMREGWILTFKHCPTRCFFTAGLYREATGREYYKIVWHRHPNMEPRHEDIWSPSAWTLACHIVDYVGRQRPIKGLAPPSTHV